LGGLTRAVNYNVALIWLPAADRTITQIFEYDSLGRLSSEAVQIGADIPHTVSSTWSLTADGVWQRQIDYSTSLGTTEWLETFDKGG